MQNSELGYYQLSYHELNEDSHHMPPLDRYGMFVDDDSCSCSLIMIKSARKDTNYSEDRGLSSDQRPFLDEDISGQINPEEDIDEELIEKLRAARIEQQDRIGSYLKKLTCKIQYQNMVYPLQTTKKSVHLRKIKKSRR